MVDYMVERWWSSLDLGRAIRFEHSPSLVAVGVIEPKWSQLEFYGSWCVDNVVKNICSTYVDDHCFTAAFDYFKIEFYESCLLNINKISLVPQRVKIAFGFLGEHVVFEILKFKLSCCLGKLKKLPNVRILQRGYSLIERGPVGYELGQWTVSWVRGDWRVECFVLGC